MLLIYPLKLYSPTVVLDSCSCSDISVYYLNPVWLFRNQEGIASTLVPTAADRKADTANSSRLCAPAVVACVGQVLWTAALLLGAKAGCVHLLQEGGCAGWEIVEAETECFICGMGGNAERVVFPGSFFHSWSSRIVHFRYADTINCVNGNFLNLKMNFLENIRHKTMWWCS